MHFVVSLAGLIFDIKFCLIWSSPDCNIDIFQPQTGIWRAARRDFSSMGHVVGEIYSEVGFGGHFPPFLATKQANSPISCCFLEKTLWEALRIPVYDWKTILQSGELQIKQNLMSKIKPAKLATKMQLIDLWTPVFSYKTLFLAQIHNTSLKLVPTVNFQPNSKNSFIWIIHEQTV